MKIVLFYLSTKAVLCEFLGYDWESLRSMRANALLAKTCSSLVPAGSGLLPSAYPHLLLVGSGTI